MAQSPNGLVLLRARGSSSCQGPRVGEEPGCSDYAPGSWSALTPGGWSRGSFGEQSCLQTHGGLPTQSPDWRLCDLGQVPPHPGSWSLSSSVCEIHLLSVPSCCIETFSPSAPLSLCLKVWTMLVPEVLVHRTLLFHASVSPPKPFLPREEVSRIELGGMACSLWD